MKKDGRSIKHQGELYDIYIAMRDLRAAYTKRRLGQPARGLLEILEQVAKAATDGHRDGAIIDVHLDIYTPAAFPSWEVDNDGVVSPPLFEEGNDDSFGGIE